MLSLQSISDTKKLKYSQNLFNTKNKMAEDYPEIVNNSSDMACEAMPSWGGTWTEEKLAAFSKYVQAYLTIMNKYRDQYGWKLIYFDGFAGSGSRGEKDDIANEEPSLFDASEIEISENEYDVYTGAAERVLQVNTRGFDYYYFNEKDDDSITSLKEKLQSYSLYPKCVFRCNDANMELMTMSKALLKNRKLKALVLLDPFGMQLNWESIASLKNCGADVWILVPTGTIINRLLDGKGKLLLSNKLQKFFGLSEEEIRSFFYENKTEATLFGDEIICTKLPNAIPRIAELYVKRLKEIFKFVTEKPLVLSNTRGVPIFHFVFASNNATATKIANDIVGPKRNKK